MSIFDEKNIINKKTRQLPELDDEYELLRQKIAKMTISEIWGETTLSDLLDGPTQPRKFREEQARKQRAS